MFDFILFIFIDKFWFIYVLNVNFIACMYPKPNKLKVMLYEKYFPTQCTDQYLDTY